MNVDHGDSRRRGRHNNSNDNTRVSEHPNQAYGQRRSSYNSSTNASQGFHIKGQASYPKHKQHKQNGGSTYIPRANSFGSNGYSNGHNTGKPNPSFDRTIPTQQSRVVKHTRKPTFGNAARGISTGLPVAMAADNPFSSYISTNERTSHAIVEERERTRRFILANYTSIQEDNPNLAYLVEMCINSPTKDLHQVIRTHAFLDLMQYNDMDQICAEIFHFYVGISQCRGGHDKMGDDVVMCDCDGRVPLCFTLAFMSLLRDYLELKKISTVSTRSWRR